MSTTTLSSAEIAEVAAVRAVIERMSSDGSIAPR
jgi:hypothetical protein